MTGTSLRPTSVCLNPWFLSVWLFFTARLRSRVRPHALNPHRYQKVILSHAATPAAPSFLPCFLPPPSPTHYCTAPEPGAVRGAPSHGAGASGARGRRQTPRCRAAPPCGATRRAAEAVDGGTKQAGGGRGRRRRGRCGFVKVPPPQTALTRCFAMLDLLLLSALSSALAENYVAWSSVTSSGAGPGGRVSMASTAKSIAETAALGDQVWIFGGISSAVPPVYSSELWTFDMHTATWSQVAKAGSPPALEGSVMCAVCCSAPQLHMPMPCPRALRPNGTAGTSCAGGPQAARLRGWRRDPRSAGRPVHLRHAHPRVEQPRRRWHHPFRAQLPRDGPDGGKHLPLRRKRCSVSATRRSACSGDGCPPLEAAQHARHRAFCAEGAHLDQERRVPLPLRRQGSRRWPLERRPRARHEQDLLADAADYRRAAARPRRTHRHRSGRSHVRLRRGVQPRQAQRRARAGPPHPALVATPQRGRATGAALGPLRHAHLTADLHLRRRGPGAAGGCHTCPEEPVPCGWLRRARNRPPPHSPPRLPVPGAF